MRSRITVETDKIVQVAPEMHVGEDEEGLGSRVSERGQAAFFLKSTPRYGKAFRDIVTIVARGEEAPETQASAATNEAPLGVSLRAIEPGDAPALRRAFAALSPVSRYRRFQRDLAEMSEEMARYLTHVDGVAHLAWIAVHVSPDLKDERIVGVARAIRLAADADVAEVAVTVADDFQRHGLGRRLLETLGAAARRQGIRAFRAEVLATNEPAVLALDNLASGTREGELVVYEIPLDARTDSADSADSSVFARFVRLASSPMGRAFRSLR